MKKSLFILLLLISTICTAQTSVVNYNQSNLAKRVTMDIKGEKIGLVLQKIGKAGGFYFTYNGALFARDSIVNVNVRNKPVREILDELKPGVKEACTGMLVKKLGIFMF